MSYSRRASHADPSGRGWYDATKSGLAAAVTGYFKKAGNNDTSIRRIQENGASDSGRLLALIAPHAGISYSGQTAADAYLRLWQYLYPSVAGSAGSRVRRVFILGPSHHKGFEGVEISGASQYETPFGDVPVDTKVTADLKQACRENGVPAAFTSQRTDEDEHSIEMQMPFLSYILHTPPTVGMKPIAPRISIVPVIVGWGERSTEEHLSRIMQPYLSNEENVFILSSDFCHWGSRFRYTYHYQKDKYPHIGDAIIAMDHAAMDLLEAKDISGWYDYFQETDNTICGRRPISVGLNWWTNKHNADSAKTTLEFVSYSQSNKCSNVRDSSVSYASAIVRQVA